MSSYSSRQKWGYVLLPTLCHIEFHHLCISILLRAVHLKKNIQLVNFNFLLWLSVGCAQIQPEFLPIGINFDMHWLL